MYLTKLFNSKKLKIIIPIVSTMLFLICIEISMRVAGLYLNIDFTLYFKELVNSNRLPKQLFVHDKILGLKLVPNQQVLVTTSDFSVIYSINSKGCRATEYSYNRSPEKIRILILGDSLTFGEGVERHKRFTNILQSKISNIEVINCGVPGYGIDQALMYYLSEGHKYSADYVVLVLHRWMNIRNNIKIIKNNKLRNIEHLSNSHAETMQPLILHKSTSTIHHSYLLSYVYYHLKRYLIQSHLKAHDLLTWKIISKNHNSTHQPHLEDRAVFLIKLFIKETKRHNSTPIISNIIHQSMPYMNNIHENYYDLYERTQSASTKTSIRFKYDPHPNEFAHSIIAEELINIFKKKLAIIRSLQ